MKTIIGAACSVGLAVLVFVGGTARAEYIDTMEFEIESGYRIDDFDWNIAGDSANVLSELTWKDLGIYQVGASGKLAIGNEYAGFLTYIRGSFDYGWILNGDWQDSDFHGNNRAIEYSRSIGTTEDDNVLDGSIGLGFQGKFWQDRLAIAPLGGYSYHKQNLRNTNAFQQISDTRFALNLPPVGPIPGLNETYEAVWWGPWAGVDLEYTPFPRFSLLGTFEYHWADYKADADWNLRTDFAHPVSFTHKANDASGILAKVTGRYLLARTWALDLSYTYQNWQAKDGTDTTFLSTGATSTTKLNEVNWKTSAFIVGLSYKFF
ncbi:MAG: hypothetical protein P8Y63_08510 [Deltaproteobacteria bacterium]|jgi:hypothetical protein